MLFRSISSDELLQLAAAAESTTNHPLALAIQQAAAHLNLTLPSILNSHTEPGLGITAEVSHQPLIIGNQRWLTEKGIEIDTTWQIKAENLTTQGKTLIYVGIDGVMMGLIAVTDKLRPDAELTVKQLQSKGLRVVLLTGDRQPVAALVAAQLGITDIYAEVLPQDKARMIQSLQANHLAPDAPHKVGMIGDGINDAPALAQADVGISLNAGTDVAIEVADLILMRDRLLDIISAIDLSQATLTKIRQNLFWAMIYNAIGIPAAAGVLYYFGWGAMLSPSAAGAMMALSSVSVVSNSLLLRIKFRKSSV